YSYCRPRRSVCAPGALAHSSNRKPDTHNRSPTMLFFCRKTRFGVSPKPRTAKPRLELLEERQLLSGFGPADGAFIAESWYSGSGGYQDVQIQPVDQKIVAAGSVSTTHGAAVARYDSVGNPDTSYGSNGLSTPPGGRPAFYVGLALQ